MRVTPKPSDVKAMLILKWLICHRGIYVSQ